MKLTEEARAVARKVEEVASYHAGTDLAERLKHAEDGMAAQREQMLAAVKIIDRLVEALDERRA